MSSPSPSLRPDQEGNPLFATTTTTRTTTSKKRKKHQAQHSSSQRPPRDSPLDEEEEENLGEAGNNSDNSSGGIMSIGNNSFGFNFDNEEALSAGRNSGGGSGAGSNNDSNNEDDNNSDDRKSDSSSNSRFGGGVGSFRPAIHKNHNHHTKHTGLSMMLTQESRTTTGLSSLTTHSSSNDQKGISSNEGDDDNNNENNNATATTTITLSSSTSKATSGLTGELSLTSDSPPPPMSNESSNSSNNNKKRKTPEDDNDAEPTAMMSHHALLAAIAESSRSAGLSNNTNINNNSHMYDCAIDDSGGYSDNESATTSQHDGGGGGDDYSKSGGGHRRKKKLDNNKREERNQREKERSFRISKQITELRDLLSNGGVVVPKGTKSSVLTEAANYIRMLQQHQYRSEIDRHQLIQQMQLIGQGAHGPQAAQAIRHFAAKNGVWSLGNFGGVPPKSAMNFTTQADGSGKSSNSAAAPDAAKSEEPLSSPTDSNAFQQNKVEPSEYRFIFNSCGVGMAIASMGGAFVDCNQLFCQLSSYSKQEVCGMTIFNMTARSDLQRAFDQISQLISPPIDDIAQSNEQPGGSERQPVTFRGSLRHRDDLGLCVSLVKGEDGVSKCFCVSLVKNPTSPFENSQPVAASFESILSNTTTTPSQDMATEKSAPANATPAFTSG